MARVHVTSSVNPGDCLRIGTYLLVVHGHTQLEEDGRAPAGTAASEETILSCATVPFSSRNCIGEPPYPARGAAADPIEISTIFTRHSFVSRRVQETRRSCFAGHGIVLLAEAGERSAAPLA